MDNWRRGKKKYLINEVKKNNLNNIKILPYQDRDLMPYINSFADLHFISISTEMEQEGFPSKVYTIMACEKPMIVITGENTPLFNFLETLDCSILISDERNEGFVQAIMDLKDNDNKKKQLAKNGFDIIQKYYTKEKVVSSYFNLFENL